MTPPTPEAGERFRPITGKEGAAAAIGVFGGAATNVIVSVHLGAEGLTIDEKNDKLGEAHGKLDSYQQVARDARASNDPDAPAAVRFTGQEIAQTKQKIVVLSGKEPIDTAENYGEAAGWGALVGVVALTALTHIVRRASHYIRTR